MSNLLERGPDGRFIPLSAVLWVWVPILLDFALNYSADPLKKILAVGCHWCNRRAGKEYAKAAEVLALDTGLFPYSSAENCARHYIVAAENWFRQKAILESAIEELKQL